jgi:hypothetical protein
MLEFMLDEEVLEVTIVAVAIGIIILAMLTPRSFTLPILLTGVFLFVVGLLINAGVAAALVLVGMVGFCAALAGEHYLWKKKNSKKEVSRSKTFRV